MRYIWTRDALRMANGGLWNPLEHGPGAQPAGVGHWLDAMSYAVEHADYVLEGGRPRDTSAGPYLPERHPGRYFRIHDSGDFFAPGYVWMWKEIANRFPDILFWAPSRYWATGKGAKQVNEINANPGNLVIKPSAYHINEPPPQNLGPGWAAGSTAHAREEKDAGYARGEFDWDCQAYAVEEESHSCRHAVAPDGQRGCRACWRFSDATICYTLH